MVILCYASCDVLLASDQPTIKRGPQMMKIHHIPPGILYKCLSLGEVIIPKISVCKDHHLENNSSWQYKRYIYMYTVQYVYIYILIHIYIYDIWDHRTGPILFTPHHTLCCFWMSILPFMVGVKPRFWDPNHTLGDPISPWYICIHSQFPYK